MTRHRLPDRRPCLTYDIVIGGNTYAATIGYDPGSGRPMELFLFGAKTGSDMQFAIDDAAIAVSIAAQHGIPAAEFARSISRLPAFADGVTGEPATAFGTAIELFSEAQRAAETGEVT